MQTNRMRAVVAASLLALMISGCSGGGVTTMSVTPSPTAQPRPTSAPLPTPTSETEPAACFTHDATVRIELTELRRTVCAVAGVVVTVSLAHTNGHPWSVQRSPDGAVVALGDVSIEPDGSSTTSIRALRAGSTEVTLQAGPVSPTGPILEATLTITVPPR
ncbi:hypothetical protein [Kutzneria chonburiensis]|uniref:DUF4232 domain-containing protein n=1 Tax=Kutzneria chonburiensis TaxID=1483604 RepID=A0ABV6MN27_9PSEU|nr:hypothetical protein [Kutzneria chonburiensis]